MPNRILKESIRTSETINELTPEEEVFFYRLLTCCDDYGRFDGRIEIIRAACFPLRLAVVTGDHIRAWIETLIRVGLLKMYQVEGKPYLQVVTWDKHQQIRAKKSKYPAPESGSELVISDDIRCMQAKAADSVCCRNPNPNQDPNQDRSSLERDIASKKDRGNREYMRANFVSPASPEASTEPPNPEAPEPARKKQVTKRKYADYVAMTEQEYAALVDRLGSEERARRAIEILDNYKGAKGKRYKSDYRAILNWVVGRLEEEEARQKARDSPKIPRAYRSLMELAASEGGNGP